MDRRDFVKALMAGGALGAASGTTHAQRGHAASAGSVSVALIIQRGIASANELADDIGRALAEAGIGFATLECAARPTHAEAAALLDRPAGSWLIGVTQDAAAEICQAVAATRGNACVLRGQHRIGRHDVHHCCTSPAVDEALRWSERRSVGSDATGRLYAQALGAASPPGGDGRADRHPARAADAAATARLASFLIRL